LKIRALRAELFHACRWSDGRRDVTKLIVAFSNSRTFLKVDYTVDTKGY